MSALDEARDRFLALQARQAAALAPEPAWLAALRRGALESFRDEGLPTTRREEWRYTSLAPLAKTRFAAPPVDSPVSRDEVEKLCFPVFACALYIFVDGHFRPELSTAQEVAAGVRVRSLAELRAGSPERLEPHLGTLVDTKRHPFAALNTAFLDDGAVLFVPRGVRVEQALHAVFLSTGGDEPAAQHPRVLIHAEPGSRVQWIQDHVSLAAGGGLTNTVTEVSLGADAEVDLVTIQRKASDAFHVSNLAVHQERDSRFSAHTLTLGGRLVRNDAEAVLAGEGAECRLNGLYVGAGDALIDNHTHIDHAVPHGTSWELYKGVLGGRSRGVFRGCVTVRPDAQKTNAEQSNPNLLLADTAEIDTRPQLEIHADDVKCSHGSAIGQLEEDALFYLRSRGIGEREARDVLTRGFAHEILDGLPVPALVEGLDEVLLARLADAGGDAP